MVSVATKNNPSMFLLVKGLELLKKKATQRKNKSWTHSERFGPFKESKSNRRFTHILTKLSPNTEANQIAHILGVP